MKNTIDKIDTIEKAIYYVLLQKPNEYHNIEYIYYTLYNDDELFYIINEPYNELIPSKLNVIFKIICNNLKNEYENIRMIYKRDILFLALITEDIPVNKKNVNIYEKDIINDKQYETQCIFIEAVIKYDLVTKIDIHNYYHENNTLLHSICFHGSIKLLHDVINIWKIDTTIKNKQNKSLFEICKCRCNGDKFIEILHNYENKQNIDYHKLSQEYTKEIETLKIKINEYNNEIIILKKNMNKYKTCMLYCNYYFIFLFVSCCLYIGFLTYG
jgi:hypothetical protein